MESMEAEERSGSGFETPGDPVDDLQEGTI